MFAKNILDVSCSNCFVAIDADVFVSIQFAHWEVVNASAGLRNINVVGASVIDAKVNKGWNAAVSSPACMPQSFVPCSPRVMSRGI